MGDLDGRVAIVTGSGRGIGREIARELAAAGARVVVADNGTGIGGDGADASVAEAVAAEIGAQAAAWGGDVAAEGAASVLVQTALDRFGAIDIVVNNAAILRPGLVFKSTGEDWIKTIEVNLTAGYRLFVAATPHMRRQFKEGRGAPGGWGRIVSIGSTVGFRGNPGQGAYAASKAGLFALTRTAALELAPAKITANVVAPFAATRVSESLAGGSDEHEAHRRRMLDLGPQHVAPVVAWLCADRAAHISGQVFTVRGKEIGLMSQPQLAGAITADGERWTAETIAQCAEAAFSGLYTELASDREIFLRAR